MPWNKEEIGKKKKKMKKAKEEDEGKWACWQREKKEGQKVKEGQTSFIPNKILWNEK